MASMKYFPAILLSFALVSVDGQAPPKAAQPKQVPIDEDAASRITFGCDRVNMLYTVTDKKGTLRHGLNKNDFEIFEDKRPQKILEFTAETDLPLRILF